MRLHDAGTAVAYACAWHFGVATLLMAARALIIMCFMIIMNSQSLHAGIMHVTYAYREKFRFAQKPLLYLIK